MITPMLQDAPSITPASSRRLASNRERNERTDGGLAHLIEPPDFDIPEGHREFASPEARGFLPRVTGGRTGSFQPQ
jgi:hypothetical protein